VSNVSTGNGGNIVDALDEEASCDCVPGLLAIEEGDVGWSFCVVIFTQDLSKVLTNNGVCHGEGVGSGAEGLACLFSDQR